MPIKPENKGRYPANWASEIRPRILARAGNRCEECGAPNGWYRHNVTQDVEEPDSTTVQSWMWQIEMGATFTLTKIVLTVAHLDHQPENCADENLRAWCQRDHLAYDREHHNETAYATRRSGRALGDFFPESGAGRH